MPDSKVKILIFGLALIACSAVCRCPAVYKRLMEALPAAQRAPEPTPQVSAQFRADIEQLAAEGVRLKEAVEASLEGSAHHLAAIFERRNPKEPGEAYEFRLIENDGQKSKTIFRRSEFFFTFAVSDDLSKLNATDINGDGSKEIIIQSSSGGNCWSCNPTEINHHREHKGELIAAGPFQKIADLNNDAVAELIVADARWEVYDDLSHAASPSALMVYAWRGGHYVYASRDFASFYKSEAARLRGLIDKAKAEITEDEFSDEQYVGLAISLAITQAHAGDIEGGLKEMESIMRSNIRSDEQAKRREKIINDFRQGESAGKLREMKHGDPLPLG